MTVLCLPSQGLVEASFVALCQSLLRFFLVEFKVGRRVCMHRSPAIELVISC